MNRPSRWLRKMAGFAGGLLAAAILFEIYLRIAEATPLWRVLPAAEVSLYGPDPQTGYALRPDVEGPWLTENRTRVRISAQGLRDHDTAYVKPPEMYRIAIAGDSITEALQVELDATFAMLLEKRYQEAGIPVETVNLGLSGAVPAVQLARMAVLGRRFEPDLMLFVINASDLVAPGMADDSSFPGYVRAGDEAYRLSYRFRERRSYRFRTSLMGQTYYWAMDHSRLMRVVNARRNQGFGGATVSGSARSAECSGGQASTLGVLADDGFTDTDKGRILDAFIRDVAALANTEDIPAAIALRGLGHPCLARDRALKQKVESFLLTRLDDAGIALLDMDREIETALARHGNHVSTRDLYGFGAHLGRGHLNEFGHQIFSDALIAGLSPLLNKKNQDRSKNIGIQPSIPD